VLFALSWPVALAAVPLWLMTGIVFRYSSLATLVATAGAAVIASVTLDSHRALLIIAVAILIFLRHHENIRRLIGRTESRISFSKS
jgi:glycerol-3-phosphate acyltransferase PlsY